jgi:hypothetical protein
MGTVFCIFLLYTDYFLKDGIWLTEISWLDIQIWSINHGPLGFLYYFFYSTPLLFGIFFLYITARKERDIIKKKRLLNMFWIIVIGVVPPTITSVFFPIFGLEKYDWIGPFTGIFWVFLTSYFLLKKDRTEQVFPVLIVKTELIIIVMIFIFGIGMFV